MSPMMQRAIAEIHELNESQITRVLQLIALNEGKGVVHDSIEV